MLYQLPDCSFLQQSHPEELPCEGEATSENLLREAMRNSGIVIERVAVEEMQKPDTEPAVAAAEGLQNEVVEAEEEPCGEQCVEVEQAEAVCLYSIDSLCNVPCPHLVVHSTVSMLPSVHLSLCSGSCVRF